MLLWSSAKFVWLALMVLLSTSLIEAAPARSSLGSKLDSPKSSLPAKLPELPKLADKKAPAVQAKPAEKKTPPPVPPKPASLKSPALAKPIINKKTPSTVPANPDKLRAPAKPITNKKTPPTVPAKPDKLRAPATPGKSKNGQKPRCKFPRSKSKLGKRILDDDCEEWDDAAPAMKDNSGAPDVAKDNPGHFGVSGKWKYTDSKHPNAPMNAETLNKLTGKQAKNQEAHWAQIKNEMQTQGTNPPWKDREPPVNSFQAKKEDGKDYWTLRGASNQVLKPGRSRDDNPPKTPEKLTALYKDSGASRAYHQNNPLHAEEVNAAQREHEGKKPFDGTLNSAHETRVGEDNRPLPACGKSCAKQIKAGDGTDANPEASPVTPYQEKERAKKAARKKAKMAPQGSDDEYTPGVSSGWGRRSLATPFERSDTDNYMGQYDNLKVYRRMLSLRSMSMQF